MSPYRVAALTPPPVVHTRLTVEHPVVAWTMLVLLIGALLVLLIGAFGAVMLDGVSLGLRMIVVPLVLADLALWPCVFVQRVPVENGIPWRRAFVEATILSGAMYWRRWAGGRWARCLLVQASPDARREHSELWRTLLLRGVVSDTTADWNDARRVRWRSVEHCPRGHCALPLTGTTGMWCACEVYP